MAGELVDQLRYLWIHRKGKKTPYAAISDVIDAVYGKKETRPLIVKEIRLNEKAWRYIIHLPPGTGYAHFKKQEHLFADATGGTVHTEKRGIKIIMEVLTEVLGTSYPFSMFDPAKYPDMYLPMPIGISAKGLIVRDLVDFPHFFAGGETNFGKSNTLHVFANSILLYRPETFLVLVDPKSTEFAYLETRALVVDDMMQVGALLKKLNEQMDTRKKLLKAAGCVKIQKYLEKGYDMPFIVLIIDEWADLPEDVQDDLWRLLRMGRFVGIHVIAATQRPSSKTFERFGDMKAMFYGRLSFVVADELNSRMIIDSDLAAHLPAIKGRAIYRCGLDLLEVQTLFLDPEDAAQKLKTQNIVAREVITLDESPKVLPPRQNLALPPGKGRGAEHIPNMAPLVPRSKPKNGRRTP